MSAAPVSIPPPRISVVTPSYNQGKYLEQCIRSILEQGYPDLEYIIMDGGSTDDSVQVIQKYAAQITYWVSERDNGQSDAINKGFQRATGDVVAWLNADDFYAPGALAAVAKAFCQDPDATFYFGNGLRVNEQGQPLATMFQPGQVAFNRPALIYGLNYILQPATFINRKYLPRAGYLNTTLSYTMDTDLWIRLSALGEPAPLQETLAASREYQNTKTSTGSFRRIEEIRALAEQYSQVPMTPGALCYFLDTLVRLTDQRQDVFPDWYRQELLHLWESTARLMRRYGANPDGSPVTGSEPESIPTQAPPPPPPRWYHHLPEWVRAPARRARALIRRLR